MLADLAVLYATKMDNTYRKLFFEITRDKFIKEIKYLKDETTYKILWSFLKSNELTIDDKSQDWMTVKQAIIKRCKELSPKTMADILVLSTQEVNTHSGDLFSSVESDLILMMKAMSLEDLINLMWSALEINRGSPLFYETLESELARRVRGIKDEQFEILLACFAGDKSDHATEKFSKKFLNLVLKVVRDKKDRFNLKTLV